MTSAEMIQLSAQAIGLVACGVQISAIKIRNDKKSMLIISGAHLLFAVSFVMLGLVSGAMLSIVAMAKILWMQFSKNGRSKRFSNYVWVEIFSAICISSVIVSYTMLQNGWVEIFPLGGVLLTLFGATCPKKPLAHSLMLASSVFWLAYDILGFAIGALISEIISAVFHIKSILKNKY